MSPKKSIHFIINTISGKGRNNLDKKLIDSVFSPKKYYTVLKKTKKPEDIIKHTKESIKLCPYIIVACGGDGTINQIGSLLVDKSIKLGIIRFGSGNALARSLNIPKKVFNALKVIKEEQTKKIDVGLVNQRYFFCNVGLGITAKIIYNYKLNNKRGLTSYIQAIAKVIFRKATYRTLKLKIDKKEDELRPYLFFISNTGKIGYNLWLTQETPLNDGRLNLLYTNKMNFIERLVFIYSLLTKTIQQSEKIHTTKFEFLEVSSESKGKFLIQVDGDPVLIRRDTVLISVKTKALEVLVPKN
tara:strand:- start:138 stop:1037 length:900 start_codon:yes stop_codon:yes gene_type:complete